MSQADEFFSDLKEWSARKLRIIEKYIVGFSKILGSRHKDIYYVDGFAGRGKYDKGEKGSPVLAAETAQRFQQSNSSFTLHCLNIEKEPDNYSNLCTKTESFGNLVKNFWGTFEENIDDILSKTNNHPAVFFIDPFGIKGTGWISVKRILTRKEPTDVWIRFDHKTVRRLFGFFDSDAKDAQSKLHNLQNLFGITDSDFLRERLGEGATPEVRINNAVTLYINQIETTFKKYGKKGFAASYPIISLDGQRKYHLIFACAHPKAATLASNIVNSIEETFQHEKEEYQETKSRQMSLFTSEATEKQIFDEKVEKLKNALRLLPRNKPFVREALHYELLVLDKKWFGKIGRRHLTQALKGLLNESSPRIKCIGTPGNDKSAITILE